MSRWFKSSMPSQCLAMGRIAWMFAILVALVPWAAAGAGSAEEAPESPLAFIDTSFENASPLYWENGADGTTDVFLVYDQERRSPNRANGHWFFQLQAERGAELTIMLNNFDNVWNGKHGSPINSQTICFASTDGKQWRVIPGEKTDDNRLKIPVRMEQETLYLARLEPYRLSDLDALKKSIAGNPLVEITPIGRTVEGRELEIIRVGNPEAPRRVLLRARSHPWEPGGNWVVQGLIRRLLKDDADARRYLDRYCVYVMPMANKDGVARGRTRFNSQGSDLNRKWDRPADPRYAPENHALESWLKKMIAAGRRPDLAIDWHNDASGKLHISRPNIDLEAYLERMRVFEELLRKHTWFTEGSTGGNFRNPGTFGEGLLERYGITACIHELNANWIAGLNDYPTARHWETYGAQLCEVFFDYFDSP